MARITTCNLRLAKLALFWNNTFDVIDLITMLDESHCWLCTAEDQ